MQKVLYVVKPRESASVFFKNAQVAKKEGISNELVDTGQKFNRGMAPKSTQVLKPRFTSHLGQFPIDITNDELKGFINELQWQYPDNHPRNGDIIQRANIKDANDPFFNHIELTLKEGFATLDPELPEHQLILKWIRHKGEPRFAEYKANENRWPKEVRYLIMQVGQEMEESVQVAGDEVKLYTALGKKSQKDLFIIATALGINVKDDQTKEQLVALISTKYKNSEKLGREFNNRTFLQYALEMLETPKEDLNLKYIITKATRFGRGKILIKSNKTGTYILYDADTKARTNAELEAYLKRADNIDYLNRLREEFDSK